MTAISAKTILRSRHSQRPEIVLSTLLLRYPRWIHAEGRTHRLHRVGEDMEIAVPTPSLMEDPNLSRNASSSRAVPVTKLIEDVIADPARPLWWGKNVAGMQAPEELTGDALEHAKVVWDAALREAIIHARRLAEIGAHKQIVNRLLEPFSHITVVASATNWENFLALRDHPDAEPHIKLLAQAVRRELERKDNIQTRYPGEWHMPFVTGEYKVWSQFGIMPGEGTTMLDAIKLSVARCASTSYKTVDGFDMTLERAVALYNRLASANPIHASPFEHVAQVDNSHLVIPWEHPHLHGNFQGFNQLRKMLPNECVK